MDLYKLVWLNRDREETFADLWDAQQAKYQAELIGDKCRIEIERV